MAFVLPSMIGSHSYHKAQVSLASQVKAQEFNSKIYKDYLQKHWLRDQLYVQVKSHESRKEKHTRESNVASPHVNTKI